jgi:hypothetical protein
MAVDNAELLKKLQEAREEVDAMAVHDDKWNENHKVKALEKINSVIESLKLMIDDGK